MGFLWVWQEVLGGFQQDTYLLGCEHPNTELSATPLLSTRGHSNTAWGGTEGPGRAPAREGMVTFSLQDRRAPTHQLSRLYPRPEEGREDKGPTGHFLW